MTPPSGWLPFGYSDTDTARAISPAAYSKSVNDPVKEEMARLRYGFGLPQRKYKGLDLRDVLNEPNGQSAYDRYLELHGQVKIGNQTLPQAVAALIGSPQYKRMVEPTDQQADNPKVRAIANLISHYRDRALEETKKQYPKIGEYERALEQRSHQSQTSPILQQLQQ